MNETAQLKGDDKGPPATQIGERVAGRYRVESVLGQGGIGAVYLTTDEVSGERVALKRLHRIHVEQKPLLGTFFMREYHTLKQLAHPSIIEAHDFGLDESGPYYTMELLSGQDLAELAPMPWQKACGVLRDIASALSLIHSRQLVHRDLSPRNVRFTSDGRAKLMDFGALASMGVCAELIGTPPFIPPEAFNRQALDARSDLYGLGAIAYWLMTGRHAYPAKKVAMLRDVWRSRPTPISALARDVPRALESLVFSLLSLDALARPVNANEVIERLIAIAGLPAGEGLADARAYLTTPSLVGRNEELVRLRKLVLRATRGRGGALLIEARSGMGRSRLLQAVELEGRLAGATVLHVSAASSAPGSSGMLGALADALLGTQPEAALAAAQVDKAMLSHVSADLHARLGNCELETGVERELPNMVQRAVGEWLLRVSSQHSLVIAVDNAERGDDRALGLLASLAQQARSQRLLLIVAVESETRPVAPEALGALRRASSVGTIGALDAAQSEALVRSVFGDVPNLALVADFVYRLSEGNPRGCMELMQHLVDRGIVRYERGSFILPASLREHELPQNLNQAMDAVLAALPPAARELCLAMAASELPLSLPEYALAMGLEADATEQALTAVDALIDARVLVIDRDGYRFRQQGYVEAAQRYPETALRRTLQLRLARIYELRGDLRRQGEHLLNAGEELAALASLVQHLENTTIGTGLASAQGPIGAGVRPDLVPDTSASVAIRKRLLEVCERHGRPPREKFLIRGGLVFLANQHDMSLMRGYVEQQIAELRRHSGAVYWNETDPALPAQARLQACIARAQRVYDETPEIERVISPTDAVGALVINVGLAQAYGRQGFEVALLEDVVELSALFSGLSRTHQISHENARHALAVVTGRVEHAAQIRAGLLAYYYGLIHSGKVVQPLGLVGCVVQTQWEGIYRAMRGGRDGMRWAQELEDSNKWPWFGTNRPLTASYGMHTQLRRAWEVRRLVELYNGNAEAARACLEPIERLTMQHAFAAYGGGVAFYEAQAFALGGDLMGLKQSVDTIATIVERQYPGWRPFLQVASGDYYRLRGELEAALAQYDAALSATGAGRHAAWTPAAAGRVEALIDLGRFDAALAAARAALEACERAELGSSAACELARVLALAEAGAGDHAGGAARLEQVIAREIELGLTGLPLGVLHETRARIALMHDDDAAFDRFAQLAAAQYRPGRNPALIARYERLIQAAGTRRFMLSEQVVRAATPETDADNDPRDANTQLEQSSDGVNRSRRALGVLIKQMQAHGALLYALNDRGIQLVTSISASPSEALERALTAYMQAELESSSDVTVTAFDQAAQGSTEASAFARVLPLVLTRDEDDRNLVVGVVALFEPQNAAAVSARALATISESMLQADEVVSVYVAS
jgi:tetratricopeptide (TPR) repeat protein